MHSMVARTHIRAVLDGRRDLTPTSYIADFRLLQPMARPDPGQFVMIRPEHGDTPFWGRPYSVAGFESDERGGRLELMIKVVGAGTALWRDLPLGCGARVVGPLGNGFKLDPPPRTAALVAGGIGLPPLLFALPRLGAAGARCDLFSGAVSAQELLEPERCARAATATGGRFVATTDDGSAGEPGLVTEALARSLDGGAAYDLVMACGPTPMLRAVGELCERHGLEAQLAMEERMGCGMGVCLGCTVHHRDGSNLRLCREGPVLNARDIQWEAPC
jgi:dihydroorotate dehydrogenase electron transfer subunit